LEIGGVQQPKPESSIGVDGFVELYRTLERPILGYCVRLTGRPDLAADLAAETFARALEGIGAFDPRRGRADQWLFGIARNVIADSQRRGRIDASARHRLGMPLLVVDDHAAEAIARLEASASGVAEALGSLPSEQRAAVEQRVVDDRSYAEIAGPTRLLGGRRAPARESRPAGAQNTTGR
jgi:RNA polymerase sigma-70 factor (ECF subfamily)